MRLLGCFTRGADEESVVEAAGKGGVSTATSGFVPRTVAELHPEYAHSEPYCFIARTESARGIEGVAGVRERERVVRGPSYGLKEMGTRDVELVVEMPNEGVYQDESEEDKENLHGNQGEQEVAPQAHHDDTPKELLAHIPVPRLSMRGDPEMSQETLLSIDSWRESAAVVREGSRSGKDEYDGGDVGETFHDAVSIHATSSVQRARRKSKAPEVAPKNQNPARRAGKSPRKSKAKPPPSDGSSGKNAVAASKKSRANSRQRSIGSKATNIPEDVEAAVAEAPLPPVRSAAAQLASQQRVLTDKLYDDPPRTTGVMRSASGGVSNMRSSKRKTVSFREEKPVIIEPNLRERVPSKSVPRDTMYNSGSSKLASALRTPRVAVDDFGGSEGSLDVPSPSSPYSSSSRLGGDLGPRSSMMFAEQVAMIEAEDNLPPKPTEAEPPALPQSSGKRMSRRSIRNSNKQTVREASRRQSKAVAEAMAQQIRGVPRSAMLAFSENEVVVEVEVEVSSDEDVHSTEDSGNSMSFKPRARSSVRNSRARSIRAPPVVVPGVVPRPPPPPPFAPEVSRVRSVRRAPPPLPVARSRNIADFYSESE